MYGLFVEHTLSDMTLWQGLGLGVLGRNVHCHRENTTPELVRNG